MIIRQAFKPGQRAVYNNKKLTFRLCDDDLFVLKYDDDTVGLSNLIEMKKAYGDRVLSLMTEPLNELSQRQSLTDTQLARLNLIEAYVQATEGLINPTSESNYLKIVAEVSEKIGDKKPPSKPTFCRWVKKYRENDNSTLCFVKGIASRGAVIHSDVWTVMDEAIVEKFLELSNPKPAFRSMSSAYKMFKVMLEAKGLDVLHTIPNPKTFERRIKSWDHLEKIEGRQGYVAAKAAARGAYKKIQVNRILKRCEADTFYVRMGILSNCRKFYIGTPTIYLIVDVHSRAVLGYWIEINLNKGGESASGVQHALRHAMSVKRDPEEFPEHGAIETLYMDNGAGYRAKTTFEYLREAGVSPKYAPTNAGWAKPFVERLIGTFRLQDLADMEGLMGKIDPSTYQNDPVKKHAKYTLSEFAEAFYQMIIKYNNTELDALKGFTPNEKWHMSRKDNPVMMFGNSVVMDMLIGDKQDGVISHSKGITIGHQRFNIKKIQDIYHENCKQDGKLEGVPVSFYVDWSDVSKITMLHPVTSERIEVPNVDQNILDECKNRAVGFAESFYCRREDLVSESVLALTSEIDIPSHYGVETPTELRETIRKKTKKIGANVPELTVENYGNLTQFFKGAASIDDPKTEDAIVKNDWSPDEF